MPHAVCLMRRAIRRVSRRYARHARPRQIYAAMRRWIAPSASRPAANNAICLPMPPASFTGRHAYARLTPRSEPVSIDCAHSRRRARRRRFSASFAPSSMPLSPHATSDVRDTRRHAPPRRTPRRHAYHARQITHDIEGRCPFDYLQCALFTPSSIPRFGRRCRLPRQ